MVHAMPKNLFLTGSAFLSAALAVSVVGFLGYYTQTGFISAPPTATVALQFLFLLAGIYRLRSGIAGRITYLWPILAFSAWALITSVAADDVVSLRRFAIILIPGFLMCLLASLDLNPHQTFARFTRLLTVVSLLSAGFALLVLLTGLGSISLNEYILQLWNEPEAPGMRIGWRAIEAFGVKFQRPSGITSNVNSFGVIASLALVCEVVRCLNRQGFSRGDRLVLLLLSMTVISTFSRSAFLFIAIAAAFLVAGRNTKLRQLSVPAMVLIAALPIVFFFFIALGFIDASPPSIPYTVGSIAHLYEAFHLRERATIWVHAYNAVSNYWLFGAGFSLIQEKVFLPLGMPTAAHSVPLTILIETGLIGLTLMLVTWFRPAIQAFLSPFTSVIPIGIAAILVALYAHQTFDSSIFRYHFLHFIFCYLLGAISNPMLIRSGGDSHGT